MKTRILKGLYKNRSLILGKLKDIRPTLVRVRKVIFDTLNIKVQENFTLLDCFAGVGTIGIEALSQGASKVVFVEINKKACIIIKKNLERMDLKSVYKVLNLNFFKIPELSPFDVIFIDPPYAKIDLIDDIIKKLFKKNCLKNGSFLIIESNQDVLQFSEENKKKIEILKMKKISKTFLFFFVIKNID